MSKHDLTEVYKEIKKMSLDELEIVNRILNEMEEYGNSVSYQNVLHCDFISEPIPPEDFFTEKCLGPCTRDIYPKWREELNFVLNPDNEVYEWVITGAIGIGKTFVSVLALSYILHTLCLMKSPARFFGLAEGSPIALGLFNIYKYKNEIPWSTLDAIVDSSPFFYKNKFRIKPPTNELHFRNNIRVLTGAEEVAALGEATIAVFLDEANEYPKDRDKNVSKIHDIYNAISARRISRFLQTGGKLDYTLMIIASSKKNTSSFTSTKIKSSTLDKHVHVSDFSLWEVKPKKIYSGVTFPVFKGTKYQTPRILTESEVSLFDADKVIEVPVEYRSFFEKDTAKNIQDLAGEETDAANKFFSVRESITSCIYDKYKHPIYQDVVPCSTQDEDKLEDYIDLEYLTIIKDGIRIFRVNPHQPRFIHVDIGLRRDSLGIAMGHVYGRKEVVRIASGNRYTTSDNVIFMDIMLKIKPKGEIELSKVRSFIIFLHDICNLNIQLVTFDGYQSTDCMQILNRRGINSGYLSVDRFKKGSPHEYPYSIFKGYILESRFIMYRYAPVITEILELEEGSDGTVDHPEGGSKDVSDCLAAICASITSGSGSSNLVPIENARVESVHAKMVLSQQKPWIRMPKDKDNPEWLIKDYE